MQTLPLELTGTEVVFLTDAIANSDVAQGLPDTAVVVPLARETLLLLGSAYTELMTPAGVKPGIVMVEVSEEQAWLFRSKVKTGDLAIDGKTVIGASLLLKLYALLLRFNSGLDDLGVAPDAVDEITEAVASNLEELHARGTDKDTGPD